MVLQDVISPWLFPLSPLTRFLADWGAASVGTKSWADWKEISEVVKNFAEVAAVPGGLFVLWTWLNERRDRATDVLSDLEKRFTNSELGAARALVESDDSYEAVAPAIAKCLLSTLVPAKNKPPTDDEAARLGGLDKLLRFYVYLRGIQKARQVPDSALRACYRYWLSFYFHPQRTAFRAYVDWFFPTVHFWLRTDETEAGRSGWPWRRRPKRFFDPTEFGWTGTEVEKRAQLRRAISNRLVKTRVLVVTGAGISAESKLPTFRGREGYWRNHNPRMLATLEEFERAPERVWEFYQDRREKIRGSAPNAAHNAVVELAIKATDFLLVTQNVDDLHDRAKHDGLWLSEKEIVHIHGQIFVTRCSNSKCNFRRWDRDSTDPIPPIPKCPSCGALLRPGVVWFDEENDPAEERRIDEFLKRGPCDVVIVIGTSATFDYIRDWILKATVSGAWLIEINPTETPISRFAHHLVRRPAAETLPELVHEAVEKGPLSVG